MGGVKWSHHFGELFDSLVKLNIHLSYDPAVSLRYLPRRNKDIGPQKNLHKNVYSSDIHKAKTWKQSKCPLTGKWINRFLYNGILLSNKITTPQV